MFAGHWCNLVAGQDMLPPLITHSALVDCCQGSEFDGARSATAGAAVEHSSAAQKENLPPAAAAAAAALPKAAVDKRLLQMLQGGGADMMAALCSTPPVSPLTCAVETALVHALQSRTQLLHDVHPGVESIAAGSREPGSGVATSVDVDGLLLVEQWRIKTWEKHRLNIWNKFPFAPLSRAEAAAARDLFATAAMKTHGVPAHRAAAIWTKYRKSAAAAHGKPADAIPMLVVAQEPAPGAVNARRLAAAGAAAEGVCGDEAAGEMPVFLAMPFGIFLAKSAQKALEINAVVSMAAAQEALLLLRQG